jgi:hypothetical protein
LPWSQQFSKYSHFLMLAWAELCYLDLVYFCYWKCYSLFQRQCRAFGVQNCFLAFQTKRTANTSAQSTSSSASPTADASSAPGSATATRTAPTGPTKTKPSAVSWHQKLAKLLAQFKLSGHLKIALGNLAQQHSEWWVDKWTYQRICQFFGAKTFRQILIYLPLST